MTPVRRPCIRAWYLAAILTVSARAHAGNDEGFLLGNQAALTGGAVTATIAEGSAIWYNPAGIAAVTAQTVDLSASAYGLRFYSAPRFLETSNGTASVNVTELIIVPTAVAYVRPLGDDWKVGFGIFVPRANDLILRANLNSGPQGHWLITEVAYDRVTYAGASLGWSAAKNLRFGASVLASYEFEQTELQFSGGTPVGSDPVAFVSSSETITRTTLGGLISLGAQWDVTPEWSLGVSVRSPAFNYYVNSVSSSFQTSFIPSDAGGVPNYEPRVVSSGVGDFAISRPVQLRWGITRRWPKAQVGIDFDASPGLDQSADNQLDPKFNVRLGATTEIFENVTIGGGLFTDRDTTTRNAQGGPAHFYGGSAGVRWGKRYDLTRGDAPRAFDFTTTLAFRYAYSHGDTANLVVGIDDSGGASPQINADSHVTHLTIHELMLHVGSGFYF